MGKVINSVDWNSPELCLEMFLGSYSCSDQHFRESYIPVAPDKDTEVPLFFFLVGKQDTDVVLFWFLLILVNIHHHFRWSIIHQARPGPGVLVVLYKTLPVRT